MKSQIKKIAITACFAVMSGLTMAQVRPLNNPPVPPAGGPGEMPPPPPGRHQRGPERSLVLKTLTTLNGKVVAYQTNDRYTYNSFTLQNGSQVITVRFPEQLGKRLMSAAGQGETVTVKGFTDNGPDGTIAFQMVSLTAGANQIVDTPPAAPIVPATAEAGIFSGSISEFKRDQGGAIRGINLDSKVQVDLPPPAVEQLRPMLKTGDKVKVTGFKDTPLSGVAMAAGAPTIVHPQTIEVNGQTYLLR
ncbi:hypothetical protein [Mucilaginibacter rubeus]|uniref:DUF5666 domain-containing protein n=1 Tax=Mucilaginibacter rubeus TaxID=2027860 RepID=A0A5C1HYX8_9SPHI|nr:hypothetical protein [Mucilaginibacter rubeus]QEM10008.1 hypothetical protein DEO27_008225 [Mucilaginibacter rubeus]